jgi:DnaJ-class molecular chaperone
VLTITLAEAATGAQKRVQLPTGKEVDVKIPAGLNNGQTIRLKGQGLAGSGGRAGDLLIAVSVAPHPMFAREGADLRLDLPITLYEAVLGAKVRVPTLDGAVELAIPAGTNSGRTFRLKGKGLPAKHGKGDLLACVRIALPDDGDADLVELMRAWQATKPYDPRKDMG